MKSDKEIIFLSHAQSDAEEAQKLADWLSSIFENSARVFASSYWGSIEMGNDWYNEIVRALKESILGVILATENSLSRRWINYEFGALSLLDKKVIPICVGEIRKEDLPSPLNRCQACNYDDENDRLQMLKSIAVSLKEPANWLTLQHARSAPTLEPKVDREQNVSQTPPNINTIYTPLSLLGSISNIKDRWATIIYTCRATFTGEECPSNVKVPKINKAVSLHLPVDEVQTFCMVTQILDTREHEDDISETILCSKEAADLIMLDRSNGGSLVYSKALLDRDLIIIGENNLSNRLLQMMSAYLPWQAHREWRAQEKTEDLRPDIFIRLIARWGIDIPPSQKEQVHEGGAMVAVFPNPYNINKRVVIFFGCHRQGQFTLEYWLKSEDIRETFRKIEEYQRNHPQDQLAIQIIVDRLWKREIHATGWLGSREAAAVPNSRDNNQPFWATTLKKAMITDTFQVDVRCNNSESMHDLSLIAQISTEAQDSLYEAIYHNISEPELYWENLKSEVGFHITLYEFWTHYRPQAELIAELDEMSTNIVEALREYEDIPSQITARIRQSELLLKALVSYVDFLNDTGQETDWLNTIRLWCENAVARVASKRSQSTKDLLNTMRVPFPTHITLCRFNRTINSRLQKAFKDTVLTSRYREFSRIPVHSLSLAIATNTPYREVKVIADIQLKSIRSV